ncbi:rCG61683 [Rattus norvegicus]|uniref:RCG61683 n=1 Tax=Rattus norvegicus TaxID=10116 RepID=A6HAZ5_RAT|nr:rCG61683 [Rattus norvegicus]
MGLNRELANCDLVPWWLLTHADETGVGLAVLYSHMKIEFGLHPASFLFRNIHRTPGGILNCLSIGLDILTVPEPLETASVFPPGLRGMARS